MSLKNTKYLITLLAKANLIILSFLSSYAMEGDSLQGEKNLQSSAFTNALIGNNPQLLPKLQVLPKVQPLSQNVRISYSPAFKEGRSQLKNNSNTIENFREVVNAQLVNPTLYQRVNKPRNGVAYGRKEHPISLSCLNNFNQLPNNINIEFGIMKGNITYLNSLMLSSQSISKLPIEIAGLIHLQLLDCSHNKIKEIPTQIGKLTNLTDLRISVNELSALPSQIGKLINLTRLDWAANQIRQAPTELGNLTNLKSVSLAGNPLSMLPFTYTEWLNTQLDQMIILSNAPVANYFLYKSTQKNSITLSSPDIWYYHNCINNEKHWIFSGTALIGYDLNSEDENCSLRRLPNDVRQLIWQNIKDTTKQEMDKIRPVRPVFQREPTLNIYGSKLSF